MCVCVCVCVCVCACASHLVLLYFRVQIQGGGGSEGAGEALCCAPSHQHHHLISNQQHKSTHCLPHVLVVWVLVASSGVAVWHTKHTHTRNEALDGINLEVQVEDGEDKALEILHKKVKHAQSFGVPVSE